MKYSEIYQFLENQNTIFRKLRKKFGQNSILKSARTLQLQIYVGFEFFTFKSREKIHFD